MNLWHHQQQAIDFALPKRGAGIGAKVGLGKTKIAIELCRAWNARKVLVIAPKAGMGVWPEQMALHSSHLEPILTDRNLNLTKRWERAHQRINMLNNNGYALIINYEATILEPWRSWLVNRVWDVIICDEAHKLKSAGGAQSKYIARLGKVAKHRLALSGTPLAQSPLDAYAECRFLDTSVFGTSNAMFRSRYAIMDPLFPSRAQSFINMDEFKAKFDSLWYTVTPEQAGVWLPEAIEIERTCELIGEGRKVYDELQGQFCAEIRGGTVTPGNAAVRLLRLQQLTSGHIRDDSAQLIKVNSSKAELLREVLEELPDDEPVVVFCRFRPDLALVHAIGSALNRQVAELSGERNELAEWKEGERNFGEGTFICSVPAPSILAVQIQAGSAANDFTRARYVIYFSVGHSLLDFEQSKGRVRRPNSTYETVFYIYLIAKNTVDRRVYRALRNNKRVIDDIMAGVFKGESIADEFTLDVDPMTGDLVK